MVSDFTDIDGEFAIVRAMTESSGRPISFTLVESPRGYEYHRAILNHIETARADGLTVTGQTAVRPIGVLLGFECTLPSLQAVLMAMCSMSMLGRLSASMYTDRLLEFINKHDQEEIIKVLNKELDEMTADIDKMRGEQKTRKSTLKKEKRERRARTIERCPG